VKCGENHNTSACLKPIDQPSKCALCEGQHPASYRGCIVYKNLQQRHQKNKKKINQDFQSYIKLLSNNNPIPVKEVIAPPQTIILILIISLTLNHTQMPLVNLIIQKSMNKPQIIFSNSSPHS
jgi:hypothetical protein